MPYVATDNASAPPAFTGSTSFHPFSHFNLFNPHKTICRNSSAAVFNFAAISTAPSRSQSGLACICAGVDQLIGAAGLMRCRVFGKRRAAKNHCPASAGVMFSNFLCVLANRSFDAAVYMALVFNRLWAVPEPRRRLGV